MERVKTIQVSVGNGRHYGGGMTVAEDARPDDGLLDVYSLEVDALVAAGGAAALAAPRHPGPLGRRAGLPHHRRWSCAPGKPRPVNTDGELTTHTPAVFRLHPAALRVFAPPRAA